MHPDDIRSEIEATLDALRAAGLSVATAESCTGGLIAAALTTPPGASDVVHGGFVTYADRAKSDMLGVPPDLITTHGAVSRAVARAMADGARARTGADLAIAVTGIAGPGGATPDKPVGLVWFGLAGRRDLEEHRIFPGGRDAVRAATVRHALALIRADLGARS